MAVVTVALSGCGYSSRRSDVVQPHQFVYFPDKGVYFEPYTQSYFWKVDSTWHHTDYPPPGIVWNDDPVKIVRTLSPRPYAQHRAVRGEHSRFWPAKINYPATPILEWNMVDASAEADPMTESPEVMQAATDSDEQIDSADTENAADETAVADASEQSEDEQTEEASQQVVGAPTNPDN